MAAVCAVLVPASADAATDHIYNGGLTHGWSVASSTFRYGPIYSRVNSDHTACGGVEFSYAGVAYNAPPTYFGMCGPGTTTYNAPSGLSGTWTGAVHNNNLSTNDQVANAYYAYDSCCHARPAPPAPGDAAAVDAAASVYPVLSRTQTEADRSAAGAFASAGMSTSVDGLIVDGARAVDETAARTVMLIPTRSGGACLAAVFPDGSGGLNCSPDDSAPVLATYGAAVGVVPAGIKEVTYTSADGTTRRQSTADGLYHAPADAAFVSFEDRSGARSIELVPVVTASHIGASHVPAL